MGRRITAARVASGERFGSAVMISEADALMALVQLLAAAQPVAAMGGAVAVRRATATRTARTRRSSFRHDPSATRGMIDRLSALGLGARAWG